MSSHDLRRKNLNDETIVKKLLFCRRVMLLLYIRLYNVTYKNK